MRNTIAKVRKKHVTDVVEYLKKVYNSPTLEYAQKALEAFNDKWEKIYPKVTRSWWYDQYELLTFYKYPSAIHRAIYTTNWIERAIKELRK